MTKIQFAFFLILFITLKCDDDHCNENFEVTLKRSCENLKYNTTHGCEYLNNQCVLKQSCDSYRGTDENWCKSIKPSDTSKKCVMSSSTCTEVTKTCSEYKSGENDCESLDAEDQNKKCVLKDGRCTAEFKVCVDSRITKEICPTIIPENSNAKCFWDSSSCQQKLKPCNEVGPYFGLECTNLETDDDDNKICVRLSGGCKEQYRTCDLYNSKVSQKKKDDCEAILIYDDNKVLDTKSKCVFDTQTQVCSKKSKECSDYSPDTCQNYTPSNKNKRCVNINEKCEEIFNTCELYDAETNKNSGDCEKIIPYETGTTYIDYYSKCVYDNSKCERKKKSCSEIENASICSSHVLDDTNKKCFYESISRKCKEEYKSCSDYNSAKNKDKKGCEAITLYNLYYQDYYNIDYQHVCEYKNEQCTQKTLEKCEDYESGKDEKYCSYIIVSNDNFQCDMKDNQCIEYYIKCPNTKDKESCLSKPLHLIYSTCEYDEKNSQCIKKEKTCSQYDKNNDEMECSELSASDEGKNCVLENNQCVEKYIECENYKGNDKTICQEITPYISANSLYKCALNSNNRCTEVLKSCEEAQTYSECNYINQVKERANNAKGCIYQNGKCKEEYKTCEDYNTNVDKTICESITLSNGVSQC